MKKSLSAHQPPPIIGILDINHAGYQKANGNEPELEQEATGRVVFNFRADDRFYELSAQYNRNHAIGCLDLANAVRQLKAAMLAIKNGKGNGFAHGRTFL